MADLPPRRYTRGNCRAHVLVVEDDLAVQELVVELLLDEGYQVETAELPDAAIEMLRHDSFDIVLTDLFGYQPALGIAAVRPVIETASPTPVGALTGHRITQEQALAAGLAFVMAKPFEVDDLLAQIDETLRGCLRTD